MYTFQYIMDTLKLLGENFSENIKNLIKIIQFSLKIS